MPLNADRLMGLQIPDRHLRYDDRDTLLYALSLGAGLGADLGLVQEQGQRVVPSFGQNLAFNDSWMEAAGVDLEMVVHGGLELSFAAPFAPAGEVDVTAGIVGLTDKGVGKAAIIRHRTEVARDGAVIFTSSSNLFVRGAGGFGGSRGEEAPRLPAPEGAPQATAEVPTRPDQALFFRLMGDRNPLHSLPEVARAAGFDRPILHGACTFGIACLTVLERYCGGDPARMAGFAARFSGPLFPGETLVFQFWETGDGVAFTAHAKERDAPVLSDGRATLR
ncbi:MaoC family dehydratase [Pseudodonghicola flavimaris]|uniref:MaoC/PaaZ C-terminal domain-containing protein n=1 Tax=Pseudodonghicola flavimaris TaxID=3050036 RepID=A0ABT7EYG6_9RHOB|nr:MaoC family dehydratase [Pseudodonghicola flavimaris]MDK3017324.1 MaoC/PaaZ C-terminal domain-containing protein [Pseudodonghicola flavimaris]